MGTARKSGLKSDEIVDAVKSGAKSDKGFSAFKNRTKPSKPKGSKPKGEYEPEVGSAERKRSIKRQNESSDKLADEGYDVEMLAEKPGGNGYGKNPDSNPDLKIGDKVYDIYSPGKSTSVEKVRSRISEKVKKQAERIVVNLDDSNLSPYEITDILNRKPITDLKEIFVIKDGTVVQLFPF